MSELMGGRVALIMARLTSTSGLRQVCIGESS